MNRPLATLLAVLPLTSLAQQASEPAAGTTTVAQQATPETSEVQEAVTKATPSLQEQLDEARGRLDALEEKGATAESDILSLKRLKFSGYVQGRFQAMENSQDGADAKGTPLVKDGFSIRRGRLKAAYGLDTMKFLLQVDATNKGVELKDAEAQFIEPWTGYGLNLTVGQMKVPFGYEVIQSSSDRDLPERSRVVRALIPGERDRGAKVGGRVGIFNFGVGAYDGNGTGNKGFIGVDNDRNKDVIGRVGVDLGWLSAGASGWWGHTFRSENAADPAAVIPAGTFDRNRLGLDVQLYGDVFDFGATSLKAEYITGNTWSKDGVEQFGAPALGWYATLTQNIGVHDTVAVRYDYFDAAPGRANVADSRDPSRPGSGNAVGTLGVAAAHSLNQHLKVTAAYEMPLTQGPSGVVDPKDNVLTVQLQARF